MFENVEIFYARIANKIHNKNYKNKNIKFFDICTILYGHSFIPIYVSFTNSPPEIALAK